MLIFTYQQEKPDFSNVKTIKYVLTILKKYSYNKKAQIWLINGKVPSLNKKELNKIDFFESEIKKTKKNFFNKMIVALVPKYCIFLLEYF